MGRKTQISKEIILDTALKMLIRDGYASINVTSLAKEIGCSTQPIVWHFDHMEGLRKALFDYSIQYVKNRYHGESRDITDVVDVIAAGTVALAKEMPNLYKYLYMDTQHGVAMKNVIDALKLYNPEEMTAMLAQEHDITPMQAEMYLLHLEIYVHGMSDYVATGFSPFSEEFVLDMIRGISENILFMGMIKKKGGNKDDFQT